MQLLLRSVYMTLFAVQAMSSSVYLCWIMQCSFKREWSSASGDLFNLAHDEQSRLPLETVLQPSLSSGLSDAPWLNRRHPGLL